MPAKEASLTLSRRRGGKDNKARSEEVKMHWQEHINGENNLLKREKAEISSMVRDVVDPDVSFEGDAGENKAKSHSEPEIIPARHPLQQETGRLETVKSTADSDVDRKLDALSESMGRKLERIAYALGIRNLNVVDNSADDAEDRKRLMDKLKTAFDHDRQRRLCDAGTGTERFLEHVFGICKADQRIGKRGSRCCSFVVLANGIRLSFCCYPLTGCAQAYSPKISLCTRF